MENKIAEDIPEAARTDLVVMLKAPANAKRRLAAEVGGLAEEAAARLLNCALEDALAWPGPTWLSPANRRDLEWLMNRAGAEFGPIRASLPTTDRTADGTAGQPSSASALHGAICGLVPQRGGNLGERINHVDRELRRRDRTVDRLVLIGTDCPGLDAAYLGQAASSLKEADAVLGPAEDGGVVLMGARRPWPDLQGLSWSGKTLRAELRDRCLEAGWRVATLDVRGDVDNLQDLLGAGRALSGDQRPSRRALADWLSAHRGALLALSAHRGALLAQRAGCGEEMARRIAS